VQLINYLIKIKENRKQKEICILSEKKDTTKTTTKIKVNDKFDFIFKKYSDNPLSNFFPNERGSQVLFIDGIKVFDPNEQLFYTLCLDGLNVIKDCDN